MRLTVLYPEVKPLIAQFAGGLMPIRLGDEAALSLVIKTQKEAILAAKMNGSFAFYLPALPSSTITTTSLISTNGWINVKDEVFDGVLDWVEELRKTPGC